MDWFEQAKKDYIPGVFGYKKIAKKYGLSVKTVESRFLKEKKRGNINISSNELPTLDDMVAQEKQKRIAANKDKILNDLVKERAIKDIIADKMISAIQILEPIEIKPLIIPHKSSYKEEEIVLQLSDIQAGTYISKEATGGLNEYNQDILKEQFNKLLNAIVSIISRQKKVAPINKLNIHMLGDMVEGM
jgi:hypothetical protein